MKIRYGFVSNSSSSSYIIKISDITSDEFIEKVYSECRYEYFNPKTIQQDIQKRLIEVKKLRIKHTASDKVSDKAIIHSEWVQKTIDDLEESQKKANELDNPSAIVKFVFDDRGIKYFESNNRLELLYSTAMHNSFNEGMDELLREIILMFAFDTKYKMSFERESDNG